MEPRTDVRLADLTTLRVGGTASRYLRAETEADLVEAVRAADAAGERVLLVAGGSNLLVTDDHVDATVVHVATRGVEVESADHCGGADVTVAAGEVWDEVVERAVAEGWVGVEALSGIPGSTGATPVQNVGAYGQEVADTIARVRVWDREEGRVRTLANADCAFTYRHSRFKGTDRYVVLSVTFQLPLGDLSAPVRYAALASGLDVELGARVPLADARAAVLQQRTQRGMVLAPDDHDTWSAGSFFTNPVLPQDQWDAFVARAAERLGADVEPPRFPAPDGHVKTSAAWLIEKAGFGKGHGLPGPASLSTKHTLALTNRGDARAADLVALAREVRDGVEAEFGVRLVNEPVLVGLTL